MEKRYAITKEFVFEDCLVTPRVYEGVLRRFDKFATPFISHLHARTQHQKARDYMKGLLSDTERKNIESISYFHGEEAIADKRFRLHAMEWIDSLGEEKQRKSSRHPENSPKKTARNLGCRSFVQA